MNTGLSRMVPALLVGMLALRAGAAECFQTEKATFKGGKAKSVIQIYFWGMAPCVLQTWDPKPNVGTAYISDPRILDTDVSGIKLGPSVPELAKVADKFTLIRSITHNASGHGDGSLMLNGWPGGGTVMHPMPGAVIKMLKGMPEVGYDNPLPPFISIPENSGRASVYGFLGPKYDAFVTGGNPRESIWQVEGISAEGLTRDDQIKERDAISRPGSLDRAMAGNALLLANRAAGDKAYDLIVGESGSVFDLSQEFRDCLRNMADKKADIRQNYLSIPVVGLDTSGKRRELTLADWKQWSGPGAKCLAARRLVEKGVPYVFLYFGGNIDGINWDAHWTYEKTTEKALSEVDRALAALITELSERRLLDTTIIIAGGEISSSPKLNWDPPYNGGRGHYPKAMSYLVAGGGFKGGQVLGATDATAETVVSRLVAPADFWASVYWLMGIDPEMFLTNPTTNEQIALLPRMDGSDGVKRYGMLKEIMEGVEP